MKDKPPSFRKLEGEVLKMIEEERRRRKVLQRLQPYNKFLVALLGAVITTVVQFYGDNTYVVMVVAILTALGVYQVPNKG